MRVTTMNKKEQARFLEVWVILSLREQIFTGIAMLALMRVPKLMHCKLAELHNLWHEALEEENPHDSLSPPN